ncbi:hypothetical protein RHECNPAF_730022 [Rhizobium etli CNPAF512]|nr:hypothetical protein RHECNPAF_730022 [Rhizobium etli CNPAF512]
MTTCEAWPVEIAAFPCALKQRRVVPVVLIEQVLQRLMLVLASQLVAGLHPMAQVRPFRAAFGLPDFVGPPAYLFVFVCGHDLLQFRPDLARCRKLGRHLPAAFSAAPAGIDTRLHIAHSFAVGRALRANLGAFTAGMFMVIGADQHEMRGRAANLGAGHHQPEMRRLRMLSTCFETVAHCRAKTNAIATQAVVDAFLHYRIHLMHVLPPIHRVTTKSSGRVSRRVDGGKKILHLLALILWKRLHPFLPEAFGRRRILFPLANSGDVVVDLGPAPPPEAQILFRKFQAWSFSAGIAIQCRTRIAPGCVRCPLAIDLGPLRIEGARVVGSAFGWRADFRSVHGSPVDAVIH